jgi:transposase
MKPSTRDDNLDDSVLQMLGISEQTYYRWKKKYGGMDASESPDGA